METAIKLAIKRGYRGNFIYQNPKNDQWYWKEECSEQLALLDPEFWKCLGKNQGWDKGYYHFGDNTCDIEMSSWQAQWHSFIDHLAEGKSPEDFFNSLTNL